jgi:hypothetical protein
MSKDLPREIADLYPSSGDWHRVFPWGYSPNRNDHYQTTFYRVTFSKDGASTERKVTVAVPRSIFWNAQAALWDIANQLRRSDQVRHRAAYRRGRAGKRARERQKAERCA